MPTRKIADPEEPTWRLSPCSHPEHNPPNMMVFKPGTYEHECPACHRKTVFTVPAIRHSINTDTRSTSDDSNPMHAFGHGRGD